MFRSRIASLAAVALLAASAMIGGCASPPGSADPTRVSDIQGVPTAQQFNRAAVNALASADAAVSATRALLRANAIKAEDAEYVVKAATLVQDGVRTARPLFSSDPIGATSKLRLVEATLTALDEYLRARQAAPPATKGASLWIPTPSSHSAFSLAFSPFASTPSSPSALLAAKSLPRTSRPKAPTSMSTSTA